MFDDSRKWHSVGMTMKALAYLTVRRGAYETQLCELPGIAAPTLVLGSASNAALPAGFDETWFLVTVNGSQLVAEHLGLDTPDLTYFCDGAVIDTRSGRYFLDLLEGRGTRHLIAGSNRPAEAARLKRELPPGYRPHRLTIMDRHVRGAIILEHTHKALVSLGRKDASISNGVFASLLALKLGAPLVVLSGISFTIPGYGYETAQSPSRSHVSGDKRACRAMAELGLPVYAENQQFAAESGLPLWRSGLLPTLERHAEPDEAVTYLGKPGNGHGRR